MNRTKKMVLCSALAIFAVVLSGCNGEDTTTVTGPYMTGKTAKLTYNAYISAAPDYIGSIVSQDGSNVMHIANFSDTLLMNDEYGILRKSLASEAYRNDDNTEFKFKVRDDVYWRTYDGSIYQAYGEDQKVCAEDFVFAAKQILNYSNDSEIYYMYTLFIEGAWEYYLYQMMVSYMTSGSIVAGFNYGDESFIYDFDAQAAQLEVLIEEYSGSAPENRITGNDITSIANFERVGVKVDDEGYLVYTLNRSASYFPTLLTYTPYMPINENFYTSVRGTLYGTGNNYILYCGPYFLTEWGENTVKYTKNEYYHDADNVHVDTINYTVAATDITYADMREAYENETIDGFTLNEQDEIGWSQYVTGPDGTGTVEEPYDGVVNSREIDEVSYTYHYVLNVNRSTENISSNNNYDTFWSSSDDGEEIIENTNAAMKIKEVRKAILNSIDMGSYNERYQLTDRDQYQINTYVPKGFIQDEYGTDYVEYYYEEYAEQKGITYEEAVEAVGPQQTSTVYYTDSGEEVGVNYDSGTDPYNDMMEAARSALTQAEEDGLLTLPISVSYLSTANLSSEYMTYDQSVVRAMNQGLNGCRIGNAGDTSLPTCEEAYGVDDYPFVYVQMSLPTSSTQYYTLTESGYYTIYTGWGWLGDYADPLTYMHTYVTNGEMSEMSGNTTLELDNYQLDSSGDLVKDEDYMFEEYNQMVNDADAITTSNQARYEAFAAAEYYLINELYIMKPSMMTSQGWSLSVSRSAGYEMPTASYGLASHIMKGMWVLVEAPTAEERKACREAQTAAKEAALAAVGNDTIAPAFDD